MKKTKTMSIKESGKGRIKRVGRQKIEYGKGEATDQLLKWSRTRES